MIEINIGVMTTFVALIGFRSCNFPPPPPLLFFLSVHCHRCRFMWYVGIVRRLREKADDNDVCMVVVDVVDDDDDDNSVDDCMMRIS